MKVSVIIPVYNCEATIDRCVRSLLSQTYSDFEILIVDDGSRDNTAEKVKALMTETDKVRFISAEHGGVSHARNEGLKNISGDYVMFADADDFLEKNCIERMVRAIEISEDCDMAVSSYTRIIYGKEFPVEKLQKSGFITKRRYIENSLKDPGHHYFGVLWNKIFKSRIIKAGPVRFHEDITLGEDFVFSLDYLRMARKVNIIEDRLYNYCYQDRSTLSRVHNKTIKDCRDELSNRIKIFNNYKKALKNAGIYDELRKRAFHYWIVFYIRQIYGIRNEYGWTVEDNSKWKKEVISDERVKQALELFSGIEIKSEYIAFALSQDIKRAVKKVFSRLRK